MVNPLYLNNKKRMGVNLLPHQMQGQDVRYGVDKEGELWMETGFLVFVFWDVVRHSNGMA